MDTMLTLRQKRLICKSLSSFWRKLDDTDLIHLEWNKIFLQSQKANDISQLCSRIRYFDKPLCKRTYMIPFSSDEIKLICQAISHYMKTLKAYRPGNMPDRIKTNSTIIDVMLLKDKFKAINKTNF
jgi:hypothetical protein